MSRLVVVSNRIAPPDEHAASAGGLAVGILGALKAAGGLGLIYLPATHLRVDSRPRQDAEIAPDRADNEKRARERHWRIGCSIRQGPVR